MLLQLQGDTKISLPGRGWVGQALPDINLLIDLLTLMTHLPLVLCLCYDFVMEAESLLLKIPAKGVPETEYIESELKKRNINPIRWAIVHVSGNMYTVSVTNLKEKE